MTTTPDPSAADMRIKNLVEDELTWTLGIDASSIGVAVQGGVVTLSGKVDHLWRRYVAARAALRVSGVHTIVNDVHVWAINNPVADAEISAAITRAMSWSTTLPSIGVTVDVRDGDVTLSGMVEWESARAATEKEISRIRGVKSVDNQIVLSARPSSRETHARIVDAFRRNARIDADAVHVAVEDKTVTLSGEVATYDEKKQAEMAAWNSPHVAEVRNRILIRPQTIYFVADDRRPDPTGNAESTVGQASR